MVWAGRRRGLVLTEVGAIHCDRQYRRSTTRSDYETLSELCFYMVEEREEGGRTRGKEKGKGRKTED